MEIWILSREVIIEIHAMTLTLPKFEMFEEGGRYESLQKR